MSYFSRLLKDNEELIRLVRRHPLAFLKPGFWAIILILLPFFLMFLLFRWGQPGLIIFLILILSGIGCLVRVIILWLKNALLITNQRLILIKQKGFFDKLASETDYTRIEEIAYRIKGFKQTVFRFGSLKIKMQNSADPMIVPEVYRPQELQQLLLNIRRQIISQD